MVKEDTSTKPPPGLQAARGQDRVPANPAGRSPLTPAGHLQGLEGRESVAVVVDDTSTVWNDHEENLLAVERYVWFPSSRRQFGLRGKSLLELNRWGRQQIVLKTKTCWQWSSKSGSPQAAGTEQVGQAVSFPSSRSFQEFGKAAVLRYGGQGRHTLEQCMHVLDWCGAPSLLSAFCTLPVRL